MYKSVKEDSGCSFECFHILTMRAPKSCLQQLDTLKANDWTNNNCATESPAASKSSPDGTQQSERHHVTGKHRISTSVYTKDAFSEVLSYLKYAMRLRYSCIYAVHVTPTLNGSSALHHIWYDMLEIYDRIMFKSRGRVLFCETAVHVFDNASIQLFWYSSYIQCRPSLIPRPTYKEERRVNIVQPHTTG